MILIRNTKIRDFPPKLQQLAIKECLKQHSSKDIDDILNMDCNSAFVWSYTEQGHSFWFKVNNGLNFEWEEGKKEKFKKGDRVISTDNGKHRGARYVEEGETGTVESCNNGDVLFIADLDGALVGRRDSFLELITNKERAPLTSLPTYWCIKITPENKELVGAYYSSGFREKSEYIYDCSMGAYYGRRNNGHFGSFKKDGVEISTEDFKKFIARPKNISDSIPYRELGIDWERLKVSAVRPSSGAQLFSTTSTGIDPIKDAWMKNDSFTLGDIASGIHEMFYGKEETKGVEKLPQAIIIKRGKTKKRKIL